MESIFVCCPLCGGKTRVKLLPDTVLQNYPLYLSILCGFFGGGDMNGIKLLLPEIAVRIVFTIIGIIHGIVIWKYLLPEYTKAFQEG